jgi:hypothetical protein
MPTITRDLAPGQQWPGGGLEGLVSFADRDALPRTTRVAIHRIALFAAIPGGGGNAFGAGGSATIELREDPANGGNAARHRMILIDAIEGTATDPNRADGSASIVLCGVIVPRFLRLGFLEHFQLLITTLGLAAATPSSLMVDFDLEPWPDGPPS